MILVKKDLLKLKLCISKGGICLSFFALAILRDGSFSNHEVMSGIKKSQECIKKVSKVIDYDYSIL